MGSGSSAEGQAVAFDREAALAAVDGDLELMAELAELFLSDAPGLVEEIRCSVRQGDAQALRRSAHTLKGAASNFRAQATVQAALRLECMGRDQDLADAEQALERLLHELDYLNPQLTKLAEAS
jgi:HPt (histidine-containing phosphotransfer) domain-containing protein